MVLDPVANEPQMVYHCELNLEPNDARITLIYSWVFKTFFFPLSYLKVNRPKF
jgi:hypothetical protein